MPGCSATFCFQNVIMFEILSAQFLIFLAISWMHSKIVPQRLLVSYFIIRNLVQ